MIWLGESRGHLTDWVTQLWVRATGRRVDLARDPWLAAPAGMPRGIGADFFADLARREGLELRTGDAASPAGLIEDLSLLAAPDFDVSRVSSAVTGFYGRTSLYDLDAWAEWYGAFRPFGRLLALLFSRRLQQLNVPLSALDTSRGMTSEVQQLVERHTGRVVQTAWVRQLHSTGQVLYAGSYSVATVPGRVGGCVKVAFPLPNGSAIVLMRPLVNQDGSLSLLSEGERFGDPGFYFTVHHAGVVHARYVRAMQERIDVYEDGAGGVRADHVLKLFGLTFLRLHYRLRLRLDRASPSPGAPRTHSTR